jgi:hypothetical protein
LIDAITSFDAFDIFMMLSRHFRHFAAITPLRFHCLDATISPCLRHASMPLR